MAKKKTNNSSKKKLTAMIPEDLMDSIHKMAKGSNLTESVVIVMEDWLRIKKLQKMMDQVLEKPLEFTMSASEIRKLNRSRR